MVLLRNCELNIPVSLSHFITDAAIVGLGRGVSANTYVYLIRVSLRRSHILFGEGGILAMQFAMSSEGGGRLF